MNEGMGNEAVLLFCGKCLSPKCPQEEQNKKRNQALGGDEQTSRYSSSVDLVFSHDGLTTGRAKPTLDHPDKYQRRIARSTEPKEGRGGHSTDTWWLCIGQKTWKTFGPIETDQATHQIGRRIQTHKSWEIRPGWETNQHSQSTTDNLISFLTFSMSDLCWNIHVHSVCTKIQHRLHFLPGLRVFGVQQKVECCFSTLQSLFPYSISVCLV